MWFAGFAGFAGAHQEWQRLGFWEREASWSDLLLQIQYKATQIPETLSLNKEKEKMKRKEREGKKERKTDMMSRGWKAMSQGILQPLQSGKLSSPEPSEGAMLTP